MKRCKIHIVKFIAIVISIIYVLMPIHKELKSALHSISHFLQMPDHLISHNQNENLNYEVKVPTILYHEHKILNLLDAFTDANTSANESNKPNLVDSIIDKHFYSSKYSLPKLIETERLSVIDSYKENLNYLFYIKIKEPPKKQFHSLYNNLLFNTRPT